MRGTMSREGRRLQAAAERAAARPPRAEHVSPAAKAVPGAFPARYSSVRGCGFCNLQVHKGEYLVKGGRHALCTARVEWAEQQPALETVRATDPTLARYAAVAWRWAQSGTRQSYPWTQPQVDVLDRLAPGWRGWIERAGDRS